MKKRMFLMAAALLLTTACFVSAKANRKYTGIQGGYGVIAGWRFWLYFHITCTVFTTVGTTPVIVATAGGTNLSYLYTSTSLTNKVYYK